MSDAPSLPRFKISKAQTPRIVFYPLTKTWFVVTRYREKFSAMGQPYIVATIKYDVSDQMKAILSKAGKKAVKRGVPGRITVS